MCGVEWIAVEDVIARFEKIRAWNVFRRWMIYFILLCMIVYVTLYIEVWYFFVVKISKRKEYESSGIL